jgi:integrase
MGVKSDGALDRRHRMAKTEPEVSRKVRDLERERDEGKPTKPGKVPTVQEWITYWLTTILPLAGRAPRTIDDYWSKSRTWIFPNVGRHRLNRLDPDHLEELYGKMAAAGMAPSTIVKVNAIISSAYNAAIKRGKVRVNPTEMVDPPELTESEKDALTGDEARSALEAAQKRRNSARWSVGLACGVRQGEALGLRWEYLVGRCDECGHVAKLTECWTTAKEVKSRDARCPKCSKPCVVEARAWYQLQRLQWKHGCEDVAACTTGKHRRPCPKDCPKAKRTSGRRHKCIPPDDNRLCPKECDRHARTCPDRQGGGLVFRPIKEKRKKTIPLAPELVELLRDHYQEQLKERLAAGSEWQDFDVVFARPDGRPTDPRDDWEEWASILNEAGVKHRGTHITRHTAATLLLDEGVALAVVQEMLGHSDIRVTRGYTHVTSPLTQDAAQRMSKALFGTVTSRTAARNGRAKRNDRSR